MRIESLKAWSSSPLGEQLTLESNAKTARRTKLSHPLGPGCVAVGKQQMGNFAEGRFCEFYVTQQGPRSSESDYDAGGVCFGITQTPPDKMPENIRSIFHVPHSWVLDVYGDLWRNQPLVRHPEFGSANQRTGQKVPGWDAYAKLSNKDNIGLLLRPDMTLKIYVNGKNVGDLALEEIAVTSEVYLLVAVLGRTEAVTINDHAKAPEIPVADDED